MLIPLIIYSHRILNFQHSIFNATPLRSYTNWTENSSDTNVIHFVERFHLFLKTFKTNSKKGKFCTRNTNYKYIIKSLPSARPTRQGNITFSVLMGKKRKTNSMAPLIQNKLFRLSAYCAIKSGLIRTVFYKPISESNIHNRNVSQIGKKCDGSIIYWEDPFLTNHIKQFKQKFVFISNI